MATVKQSGYALSVLEQTTGKDAQQINTELLVFIKQTCYAGAYFQDSLIASNAEDKKRLLKMAIELMPDYPRARYELAYVFYQEQDYAGCQKELETVLSNTTCIEYKDALQLMGDCCYNQNNARQALVHYQNALNAADYDEYQYKLYYKAAACYMAVGDKEQANIQFKDFLEKNWEPQATQKWCTLAKKCLEQE